MGNCWLVNFFCFGGSAEKDTNNNKYMPDNVYLLVLSSWKVKIAENPIAVMEL